MSRINTNLGDSGVPLNNANGGTAPGTTMRDVQELNRGGGPSTDFSRLSQRIDMVLRIGFSNRPQRKDYPIESPLGRAAKFHEAALALLGNFAREAGRVIDDVDLTPIGRTKRLASVGTDFLKRLEDLASNEPILPTLRRLRDKAAAAVKDAIKFPAADDLAAVLRERELRDRLYAMEKSSRQDAWRRIIDARDPLGIAAVVNAPSFDPLLPSRVIDEGIKSVSEGIVPDAAKTRAEAEEALRSVEGVRDDARTMIADTAGIDLKPKREGLAAADREREAAADGEGEGAAA